VCGIGGCCDRSTIIKKGRLRLIGIAVLVCCALATAHYLFFSDVSPPARLVALVIFVAAWSLDIYFGVRKVDDSPMLTIPFLLNLLLSLFYLFHYKYGDMT
jgi:hypothetical protein